MHNTDNDDIKTIPKQITLANLVKSTKQEVFDWFVYNLLKQGRKSQAYDCDGIVMSMYRGGGGTKCAAGWLIDFELNMWGDLVDDNDFPTLHSDLIKELQNIRDNHAYDEWLKLFADIADLRKLNTKYLRKDIP